jgi:hypothetical protein
LFEPRANLSIVPGGPGNPRGFVRITKFRGALAQNWLDAVIRRERPACGEQAERGRDDDREPKTAHYISTSEREPGDQRA